MMTTARCAIQEPDGALVYESEAPHPVLTDFGPRSLEQYFRSKYAGFDFFSEITQPFVYHDKNSLRSERRPAFQRELGYTRSQNSQPQHHAERKWLRETESSIDPPRKKPRIESSDNTTNEQSTSVGVGKQEADGERYQSTHNSPGSSTPTGSPTSKSSASRLQRSFDYKTYFEDVIMKMTGLPGDFIDVGGSHPGSNNSSEMCLPVNTKQDVTLCMRTFNLDRALFPKWLPHPLRFSLRSPPSCPQSEDGCKGWPEQLPQDVLHEIAKYLSFEDVKNLRLTNRQIAEQMSDMLFHSVVVPFNHELFGLNSSGAGNVQRINQIPIVSRKAASISKFGISFEFSEADLSYLPRKAYTEEVAAWWGSYTWPVGEYPRFEARKKLEDLAENRKLLVSLMSCLTNTTELGVSIDSGHGWLNGADLSDLASYELSTRKGTVFGRHFPVDHIWHRYGQEQIFRAGQEKTFDYALAQSYIQQGHLRDAFLALRVYSMESFRYRSLKSDLDEAQHSGGTPVLDPETFTLSVAEARRLYRSQYRSSIPAQLRGRLIYDPHLHPELQDRPLLRKCLMVTRHLREPDPPQYPLIFNGYNIASVFSGHVPSILDCIPDPRTSPLKPGLLSQAQAEWLMETLWAQKAFISSYVTSIIQNKQILRRIHSIHLGKISSGLLDGFASSEFWTALPQLHTVTIMVVPDWHRPLVPFDRDFHGNMRAAPFEASVALFRILKKYIAPLENVSNLKIGFIGGGEHAKGLLARNQHILPAPLTSHPREWTDKGPQRPDTSTILVLDHIEKLTLVNCWVSPAMLTTFATLARDTSLKHLVLDSVSMTASHGSHTDFLNRRDFTIDCRFPADNWLSEIVPNMPPSLVWTAAINAMTPGTTLYDHGHSPRHRSSSHHDHQQANLSPSHPLACRNDAFRGHIRRITFVSCGYAMIEGLRDDDFNQHDLVVAAVEPMNAGLMHRRNRLRLFAICNTDHRDRDLYLLGTLTQCVHPVEERLLGAAFGMTFGWGNDPRRWEPVEDGCFVGGTGRFSGHVAREGEKGVDNDDDEELTARF